MSRDRADRDVSFRRKALSLILSIAGLPRLLCRRKLPLQPKKILVIQWAYMGDIAVSTPAMKLLRSSCPASQICLLTNPETESYIKDFPFVNKIFYLKNPLQLGRRKFSVQDFFKCISFLRAERYDLVIELTGRVTNQIYLFFLRAGYMVGQDPTNNFYLFDARVSSGRKSEIVRNIDVIRASVSCPAAPSNESMWNPVTDADRESVHTLLEADGIRDYIVVHPAGSWGPRQWPVERWTKVCSYMLDKGKDIIFIGASQDSARIEEIRHGLAGRRSFNFAGMVTIRQVIALMEKAGFFLGVDSGPMHLAACVNLKGVILFGAGDPVKWAYPFHTVIYKAPACGPCAQLAFTKTCSKRYDICKGLSDINAEEVVEACKKYL